MTDERGVDVEFYEGQVFTGPYPMEAAEWCNASMAYHIEEGGVDDDGAMTYVIVANTAREPTREERLEELYGLLASYDYIGVKIATGVATREEYADKIAQAEAWRAEVNELEGKE